MENRDVFVVFGEIAVAFAGFASVVVVFRQRDQQHWTVLEQTSFHAMLRHSLAAALFALLPLLLAAFKIGAPVLWRSVSGALALYLCFPLYLGWIGRRQLPLRRLVVVLSLVGVALALQIANFFGGFPAHGSAPYLAGVFLLLLMAGWNFFRLVTNPVSEGSTD